MENSNKFYVTTPIYYVTAKPHLGSLYSTLLADVVTRWHKLQAHDTFFLTGTDEHGQKIAQAAQAAGKDPKSFVDSFIADYKKIWRDYEIDYSYFIRTTDQEHIKAVQQWIINLQKKGDIYKAFYSGWYCTPCETFIVGEQESQIKGPLCPQCSRETSYVSEESYFFRLSAYQEKLLEFYEKNPDFIVPKERLHEVINFVKAGLNDLSISRTTISWGIPFPGDDKHVVYVWADALNNYLTAIGYGQSTKQKEFQKWWPADLHVMGKDIVRFHAVYWPAFLMASDLPLPKKLLVHGWIKVGDHKMSKSRGNAVDPEGLLKAYGADAIRYYLLRQIAITHDSPFSIGDLEHHIEADLANDLGNLLKRTVSLATKYNYFELKPVAQWSEDSKAHKKNCDSMIAEYSEAMNAYMFHMALARLWQFIHQTNSFFHMNEPWKLAINNKAKFEEVISVICHSLSVIGMLLQPIMPVKMTQLLSSIGHSLELSGDQVQRLKTMEWNLSFTLKDSPALFEKPVDKLLDGVQEMQEDIEQKIDYVTIDDFAKVMLLVGTIEECTTIEKSDKLYKLLVNFGSLGRKQILSGVRKSFEISDLIGKQAVFVYNLKPRMMLGLESQGMLLTAHDEKGSSQLITIGKQVPNGTQLK